MREIILLTTTAAVADAEKPPPAPGLFLTNRYLRVIQKVCGPLTQMVEYLPFKQRVAGSSPARPTYSVRPHRLAWSRTPAFHAGNTGSNPVGDASLFINFLYIFLSKTPHFYYFQIIPKKNLTGLPISVGLLAWVTSRQTSNTNQSKEQNRLATRGRSAAVNHRTWQPGAFGIFASFPVGIPGGLLPSGSVFYV